MKAERILKSKVPIIIIVLFAVMAVGFKMNHDSKLRAEWESSRKVITVIVKNGDTLDEFGYVYKPDWMDVREYREEIKELNGLQNSTLQVGQGIQLYVCTKEYTKQGLCLEELIITADGNEWCYTSGISGCVAITFNDNGTANNICDDIIVKVKPIK